MSLEKLLNERGVKSALIVDDACDAVPRSVDVGPDGPAWTIFNDDLSAEQRDRIEAEYPEAAGRRFEELVADDGYVATVWNLRAELGEIARPLFADYVADQQSDERYVELVKQKLEGLGLTCVTAGRDFAEPAKSSDLIVIDLFFGNAQGAEALDISKRLLRKAIEPRADSPPLVILMSRSSRIEAKKDEFRDDVGLVDSAFRIITKSDLDENDRLERQLERLAENAVESRDLARFFNAIETGVSGAADRTVRLFRKLKLSDIGQIQQLLLSAEGEPTGSYLVDVFDRVLQHEIEAEAGIIDAAVKLNGFKAVRHPTPYVAGSAELQELVQRLLTQNQNRLRLPGSIDAVVAFGDILRLREGTDAEQVKGALLVDLGSDKVALVLTPACDLQRKGAPRILLLIGEIKELAPKDWSYGGDARTAAIRLDGELLWIKWNLKNIDTVAQNALEAALKAGEIRTVARLRDAHAIELQQRVLSGLGRVGLVAPMPATFPVEVEVLYANSEGRLAPLPVAALSDGAVCFVGRDEDGKQNTRLVMTEGGCDGIIQAVAGLQEDQVAKEARTAFDHIRSTSDLRKLLSSGIDLNGVGSTNWKLIPSETGSDKGVRSMGILAWNYAIPDGPLKRDFLTKAGLALLIKDIKTAETPGLEAVVRSGLVAQPVESAREAADPTPGEPAVAAVPTG
jgi:CheY-like chemotaxis protein